MKPSRRHSDCRRTNQGQQARVLPDQQGAAARVMGTTRCWWKGEPYICVVTLHTATPADVLLLIIH